MGFLPPLGLFLLAAAWLSRRWPEAAERRQAALLAALVLGLFVAGGTELLSALHLLTRVGVFSFWGLGCAAAFALLATTRHEAPLPAGKGFTVVLRGAGALSLAMAAVLTLFVTVTGLVALWAVPNNYDSMTYHLARVVHWREDHSIAFFGTSMLSQNSAPPLAEWMILHLSFLQGNAGLSNLVQWAGYVGCIAGASVVAEMMGAGPRGGLIAACFVATLPAAVLEATSTQNDLVMSFWMICLLNGCLLLHRQITYRASGVAGAALGLGLLSKTVVVLFAAPFLIGIAAMLLRRGFRFALPHLALIGLLAVTLNLGHFSRNYRTSQSIFGPDPETRPGLHSMTNDVHTIGALMSNLLRNVSLHAAVNHRTTWAEHLVIRLHRLLGLDPDDPRTTKGIGHRYFINDDGEDGRPMPFHFLLILPALGWAAAQTRRAAAAPALAACIVAGALLFCLVLKWQPYHARLHLPLFVLSAPLVALLFQPPFGRVFLAPVFLLFTWAAWPGVFNYEVRPALGRHSVFRASHDEQQYRTNLPLLPIYPPIVRLLLENHVQEVGFISDKNQWEYPIAAYGYFHGAWRTDDMLVRGCYASLETTRVPDALVCTRAGAGENLSVHGRAFRRVYTGMDPATGQVLAALYLPVQVPSR